MPKLFWCWKLLPHLITYINPPITLAENLPSHPTTYNNPTTPYHIQQPSHQPSHYTYPNILSDTTYISPPITFPQTCTWHVIPLHVERLMAWVSNHDIHDLLDSWLVHDWLMTCCSGFMACWRVHGMNQKTMGDVFMTWHDNCSMLKGSWHGAAIMAWRRCFMRLQTIHGMLSLSWPIKLWFKKISALPLFQRLLRQNEYAWPVYLLERGNLGAMISIGPWAWSMMFACQCFVVSTHVLVHSVCRAQHWMPACIMAYHGIVSKHLLHGMSYLTDICCMSFLVWKPLSLTV